MLRTQAQQKALCRDCPLARAAHLLGDTCLLLIMRDTLEGPKRFSDVSTSLAGISTRTLTNKLRFLETEGFLRKDAQNRYTPTQKGQALLPLMKAMRTYGKRYIRP